MATKDHPAIPERVLDTDALKGLAHPLRVEIYEALSVYGPATASGLGERLDESSGAMSYHLRQLAKHGFVREVEGRGTARERWWERTPGSVTLSTTSFPERSAGRTASRVVGRQFERSRSQHLEAFVNGGEESLPEEWVAPSRLTTSNLRLTAAEMAEVTRRLDAAIDGILGEFRGRSESGSRPVQVHLNIFPIVDGRPSEGSG